MGISDAEREMARSFVSVAISYFTWVCFWTMIVVGFVGPTLTAFQEPSDMAKVAMAGQALLFAVVAASTLMFFLCIWMAIGVRASLSVGLGVFHRLHIMLMRTMAMGFAVMGTTLILYISGDYEERPGFAFYTQIAALLNQGFLPLSAFVVLSTMKPQFAGFCNVPPIYEQERDDDEKAMETEKCN
jgi:hypothetical protein